MGIAAVPLADILQHLVAPFLAEVDVKVGHGDPLDVEEALKEQAVGNGVDIGDGHAVGSQTACAGTAPWPDRNLLLLGPVDKVGDDEKVAGEAHLLNDLDFVGQPVPVGGLGFR